MYAISVLALSKILLLDVTIGEDWKSTRKRRSTCGLPYQLSEEGKQMVVEEHNRLRGLEGSSNMLAMVNSEPDVMILTATDLKQNFRKYPSIHINYIISHCTTLHYNHTI